MERIGNISKFKKKELDLSLNKQYMIALKDEEFNKLINKLNCSEEILMKYTSKLENTVSELNNCKNCKGLNYCKNKVKGFINYPLVQGEGLIFSYVACKYEKEFNNIKNTITYFETPKFLREARLKDIYLDDKTRINVIKYIKRFIDSYKKGEKIKGLYLYGSFGSGKSYIINALINELGKSGVNCVSVYFPTMLKVLKDGFGTNFEGKMQEIMNADILLIDDIGAENNTAWSRDEVLGTILQHRMDNDLSTFFTSNFSIEQLEDHLKTTNKSIDNIKARRIIERIKYLTNSMELVSENLRDK